jgi:cell shape-determining protein MreC
MNSLHDRRSKKNILPYSILAVIIVFFLFFFRTGLSNLALTIFKPLLRAGNSISSIGEGNEVEKLKDKIAEDEAKMQNYNVLLDENAKLKEVLARKRETADLILAAILTKPNQNIYDTIVIDVGENQNIMLGKTVYAEGNIPIGKINEVSANSSKVILFSSPGVKTEGVISGRDVFTELVGRGGGNFAIVLPRDLSVESGTDITLPGTHPHVLAVAETTITDSRDAFTKVLLRTPVNIFELKFVEVER